MSKDNVISLENPEGKGDVLTGLLRSGARELIKKAVQAELTEFLSQYQRAPLIYTPQTVQAAANEIPDEVR